MLKNVRFRLCAVILTALAGFSIRYLLGIEYLTLGESLQFTIGMVYGAFGMYILDL